MVGLLVVSLVATGCASGEAPAARAPSAPESSASPSSTSAATPSLAEFPVPALSGPHDVAPAVDGGVWFTAQAAGYLGHLDPRDGRVSQIPLGAGSRPHGVITAGEGTVWVTDGGLNAIVRVDPATRQVTRFPLPAGRERADLNTATLGRDGSVWFTGQRGVYGRLDTRTGAMQVYDAPEGAGPYGITTTPDGNVYYASLAGSHIARIDQDSGRATVIRPPTARQGARRIWSDADGRLWVSEWNAGQVARYDPSTGRWQEWRLPGDRPQPYAVYVDDRGMVWVSDFGANRLVGFDSSAERFTSVPLPGPAAGVRQLLGRPGQVLGAASALDRLLMLRTASP
jgi:virginiamycin B lyase